MDDVDAVRLMMGKSTSLGAGFGTRDDQVVNYANLNTRQDIVRRGEVGATKCCLHFKY